MGFAKYLEDNISIYNNNVYMRENSIPKRIYETPKATPVAVFRHAKKAEKPTHVEVKIAKNLIPVTTNSKNGRRGLSLRFSAGLDTNYIRKMQMNGWWWSKSDSCWYNDNSKSNRTFANRISIELGAVLSFA